jgi:HK97 family phage prohead protease
MKYDFSGWATKNDLKCSDGLTIVKDAFKHNSGATVPLVWNHDHNDPNNVLGHAMLENRDEGVYAYCSFNTTPSAQNAKNMVEHGDIVALSIYANQLKKQGAFVMHGQIREVSLVLAGANPGAFIDDVIVHGQIRDEEGVLFTGEEIELYHADKKEDKKGAEMDKKVDPNKTKKDDPAPEDNKGKTIQEVFDTLTEEQKNVVYAMVGAAVDEVVSETKDEMSQSAIKNKGKGGEEMKHNVFNKGEGKDQGDVLSHSEIQEILADGKRYGSLKDSVLAHGIENIDYLFPDYKNVTDVPGFIQRENTWVDGVLAAVHHTPFSRIKSTYADITEDDARAKGYIKGNLKKEEVFSLLKRTTSPTTIYKKQKLDRDDVVDITDFDVVAWLKTEMRMMLNEEIARAILIGDGRPNSSDDKINELNIRPIWKDEALYTVQASYDIKGLTTDGDKANAFIEAAIKSRKNYKGSGQPSLYTTEDMLTSMLLIKDTTGRDIYDSVDKLKSKLRVADIITIPAMEGQTRVVDTKTLTLNGLIVNLTDYNIGADKGGAVNMFDDFDIDYNAQKYLIETRCSGALIKPFSAIAVESYVSA